MHFGSLTQRDGHVAKSGAVVLEQLIPQLVLPLSIVDEVSTGKGHQAEQLIAWFRHALPTAHDRQEMIDCVQMAEAGIARESPRNPCRADGDGRGCLP